MARRAMLPALTALLLGAGAAWFVRVSLRADGLALAVAAAGAAAALLLLLALRRRPRAARLLSFLSLALLAGLPVSWLVWPARITYARFGLTVYGILPLPAVDLAIDGNGLPRPRVKSHRVEPEEVRALLSDGVTDAVIATGWDGVVVVDPMVRAIEGVRIHVLPTPAALDFYRSLRAEGRRVVLILHSTC